MWPWSLWMQLRSWAINKKIFNPCMISGEFFIRCCNVVMFMVLVNSMVKCVMVCKLQLGSLKTCPLCTLLNCPYASFHEFVLAIFESSVHAKIFAILCPLRLFFFALLQNSYFCPVSVLWLFMFNLFGLFALSPFALFFYYLCALFLVLLHVSCAVAIAL